MKKVSQYEQPGPDKGFAWVVALSCFFINFIMAGLARSAGVLYVALIELYGVSRESATTPFSIRVCVRNMTGPLVGMLGQRYGIRIITMSGGALAAVGGILCYFAPDVFWITIFWGGIHGFGYGLSTALNMVAINQYFDKYRATALGIGYSGDCFGTFVLPIIIDSLLLDFGVKGTFLVIGGIILHVIPLAMSLKPPPWLSASAVKSIPKSEFQLNENKSYDNKAFVGSHTLRNESFHLGKPCQLHQEVNSIDDEIPSYEDTVKSTPTLNDNYTPSPSTDARITGTYNGVSELTKNYANACQFCSGKSQSNLPIVETIKQEDDTSKQEDDTAKQEDDTAKQVSSELTSLSLLKHSTSYGNTTAVQEHTVGEIGNVSILKNADGIKELVMENLGFNHNSVVKTTVTEHCENIKDTILRIRTLSESRRLGSKLNEKSSSPHGHLAENVHNKNTEHNCGTDMKPTPIEVCPEVKFRKGNVEVIQNPTLSSSIISYDDDIKCEKNSTDPDTAFVGSKSKDSSEFKENTMSVVLRNTIKVNMKPMFILMSFTLAVYAYLFTVVLTVIIDYGVDKGISQKAGKYFIIGFSAADLVGKLGFGVIIDKKWITTRHFSAMIFGIMGFIVALIPLCSGFLTILIAMSSFGLIQGGVAIIFPILVDEYMEKDEDSIAMGCLSFYGGLLMLSMAPMIGFFRDKYGTYDSIFHLVGIASVTVGLIWLLEPLILKCRNQRKVTKTAVKPAYEKEEISAETDA